MPLPDPRKILSAGLFACAALWAGPGAAQDGLSVSVSNARLALMQLVTATGESGAARMMQDDGGAARDAIYLQSGEASLSELAATLAETHPDALTLDDGTATARLPIVVLQGAELTVGAGETLALDPEAGAFVLSLGRVVVDGAAILGAAGGADGFRPFLAGVGQDSLSLSDSSFTGLGFGDGAYSAGVSLTGRGLLGNGASAPISGNTFRDLRGVTVSGIDAPEIIDNDFEASRGTALRIDGGSGGRVAENLFAATGGAHALKISGTDHIAVARNRFEDGAGKAVRIDNEVNGVRFAENFVTGFAGTAITLAEGAGCVQLSYNVIAGNGGAGVKAERMGTLVFDGNVLSGNRGPGIALAEQRPGARSLLIRNTLADNRSGIRATGIEMLRLAQNDLDAQRPRLLSGDLDQITPAFLRAERGPGSADIAVRGVAAEAAPPLRHNAADRAIDACSEGGAA